MWQDMAGLTEGPRPKVVKAYADMRGMLSDAAAAWADEVRSGAYPAPEHSYR